MSIPTLVWRILSQRRRRVPRSAFLKLRSCLLFGRAFGGMVYLGDVWCLLPGYAAVFPRLLVAIMETCQWARVQVTALKHKRDVPARRTKRVDVPLAF